MNTAAVKEKYNLSDAMLRALRDATGYDAGTDARINKALMVRGLANNELSFSSGSFGRNGKVIITYGLTTEGYDVSMKIKADPNSYNI